MPTLLIDPKRIRQILFNLLDNAAKFTQQGFVEVRASFERAPEGGTGTLRLEVEDTGCGISEQDLKRITSPYVQVDAKQARHGGTGIGLSICLKMAAAMGGALSIASTFGKGSTFTVTICNVEISDASPVEDDEPPAIPNAVPADISRPEPAAGPTPETPPENAAPKRILIADDQKLNLMVPVSEIREAAFEYEILVNPYDPKRKVHVPFKNHPWADLLLKVNGHEVFRGPAGPHILVGTHAFPFPVEYLKEGENLLELSWAPLKPEEKGSRSYGYIYVACDLTEDLQDVKGPQTRLAKAPESLRMRLLIK